jgi:radical SAM protein with 4Fe4S-binding SPASM domain
VIAIVDWFLDWVMVVAAGFLTLLHPFLRSKSGYANPHVRHVVGVTYQMRSAWLTTGNIDKWLSRRAPLFPTVLQVQTINRCNAACHMCPYPYTTHLQPREIMDDALYSKIVTECAAEEGFIELVPMSKNEPMLDPQLEERIAEFKRLARPHQSVELVTNGSALTPARFEKLVKSGVDLLTISVSAFTEATYRQVMEGLSWAQVMRNLEAVAASPSLAHVNVFLRYIQQAGNEAEFADFHRHWSRRGLNVLGFEINNRAGTLRDYQRLQPILSFFMRRWRKVMGRRYFKGVCPHAFSVMHVLQNGDVPLCANDWANRNLLGNVRHTSLREIYNSVRMQEIRSLMQQGRYEEIDACKECSFWKDWF